MSGKGTRFFASLFGIRLSEDTPEIHSLVPLGVENQILAGKLPIFRPSTLMLGQNETCHFMDQCAIVVKQKERSYQKRRSGSSYKLTKNYTMYSGGGITRPIDQEWYEYKLGVVFVTNKRIIFVQDEYGFEKQLKSLSAVTPYSDALSMQFGNQTISLMMSTGQLMAMVLQMVH